MIRNGQVTQRNLCEACARAKGVKVQPGPLAQALTQAVLVQGGAGAEGAAGPGAGAPVSAGALACGRCGLTYAQFRSTGMLGCAGCYEAFAGPLAPLVSRAHEGATHHVGKAPKRLGGAGQVEDPAGAGSVGPGKRVTRAAALFGSPEERRARIAVLKRQLAEAVAAEQYERAAQLRDELRRAGPEGAEGGSVSG